MKRMRSNLLLLTTALIWGAAFVAQAYGTEHIGPWTFNCVRSVIGGFTLTLLMPLLDRIRTDTKIPAAPAEKRLHLKAGIFCGLFLCAASMFQQTGIAYTSVGKAGFLTALYVIFVPLLGLFIGRKTSLKVWIAALIALAGFWFLSVSASFTVGYGDLLILACSFLFAGHILVIDHYSQSTDGVRISCIQFFTVAFICLIPMLVFEKPSMKDLMAAAIPVLYAGVMSSGAGYTMQILGQKGADPTVAGMILSLESVFSALAGYAFLHQVLSLRELSGCALVFAAVILSQLPETKKTE